MADLSQRDKYHKIVERLDQLPAFPAIVSQLLAVINSPDSSSEDAARLIEKDPALTSKMLRLANSAFYGMPRTVSSVNGAVVVLGFNSIRSIVLGASLVKIFPFGAGGSLFSVKNFWMHSFVCAIGARSIVTLCINDLMVDPESAFCAAMMHDIGKLIFNHCLPEEYNRVLTYARQKEIPVKVAEKELLHIDHAELGSIVADKWALPFELEYPIVYHHRPAEAERNPALIAAVHLADSVAHKTGAKLFADEKPNPLWREVAKTVPVTKEMMQQVSVTIKNEVEQQKSFLSIMMER